MKFFYKAINICFPFFRKNKTHKKLIKSNKCSVMLVPQNVLFQALKSQDPKDLYIVCIIRRI